MPRKRLPEAEKKRKQMEKRCRYKARNKFVSLRRDTLLRIEQIGRREGLSTRDTVSMLVHEYENKLKEDPKYKSSWKPDDPWQKIPNKGQQDKPKEDAKYLSAWNSGQQNIAPKMRPVASKVQKVSENKVVKKETKLTVPEVKPKKKRGRPPKNRPVEIEFETTKLPTMLVMNRLKVEAPRVPDYHNITNAVENNSVPGIEVMEEDPANMSPAVRSARLAFSRALQNSYKALIFQEQASPAKENDLSLIHHSQSLSTTDPSFHQPFQGMDHQQDSALLMEQPQVLESMSCQHTLELGDQSAVGLDPSKHSSLSGEIVQDHLEDPPTQEPVVVQHQFCQETEVIPGNCNDRIPMDLIPEPEPDCESQQQDRDHGNVLNANHLSRRSIVGIRKVPDPMRRSRLNQITGGLLNKLKMRAERLTADL